MKISEIMPGFKLYGARVRVKQPGYSNVADITVFAKNPFMARLIIQQQYGKNSVITVVREIK
jgi:hypothetical protein